MADGVMKRMSLIFKSKANKALDKYEDPRETLDYAYQKQLENMTQLRRSLADVATARKRIELQLKQVQLDGEKRNVQARRALEMGREDLARDALVRKAEVEAQIASLTPQHENLVKQEENLTRAVKGAQAKVEAFRTQKETIKANYTAAQAYDRSKDRPTPSRREAEAARKARLGALPSDPKERKRAERTVRNEAYQRQRAAMRSGDAKNFPARDYGPARAFVRDYVDGRLRLLEFLMPIVVVAWFTLILKNTSIYIYASFAMELVVVLGIVLGVLLNVRVKRAVRAQFGDDEVRGTGFYAFSRAAMPRFLRQPRPAVTFTGKSK